MTFEATLTQATKLDKADDLKDFRKQFHIPQHEGKDVLYFCGNSLGLQPKSTAARIQQECDDWAKFGVEGHFLGRTPWFSYHETVAAGLAHVVGAQVNEVVAMNSLTVNLHLLMASFYRPTSTRYKILIEPGAFPSDQYAVQSQAIHHGFKAADAIIELPTKTGSDLVTTEDMINTIEQNADSLALILLGAVNYKTGQAFDLKAVVETAHQHGILVGLDLAHAAGNLALSLHDTNVDFAAWCSYKYLNSGPGGIAGAFVHERHGRNTSLPRFAGWWGHNKQTRFKMDSTFDAIPTAEGWQLSNPPIFQLAALSASLELFQQATMQKLREKSERLTLFLELMLKLRLSEKVSIMTPTNVEARGCQISLRVKKGGVRELQKSLLERGVVCDVREPDILRVAPVPLYNSFTDVFTFVDTHLNELL